MKTIAERLKRYSSAKAIFDKHKSGKQRFTPTLFNVMEEYSSLNNQPLPSEQEVRVMFETNACDGIELALSESKIRGALKLLATIKTRNNEL